SDSHSLSASKDGADLVLDARLRDARLDRDVVLQIGEKDGGAARFAAARQDGHGYLLVRYRPELPGPAGPQRTGWVGLVETSGDRDPLLARTQVELVRSLLAHAGREDTFAVLTASTRARMLRPKAIRNDVEAVNEVMADLEKAHLVGAFDLGAALEAARPLLE